MKTLVIAAALAAALTTPAAAECIRWGWIGGRYICAQSQQTRHCVEWGRINGQMICIRSE
jgi:hypothetical protein